jgi:predicted RNase H-like HicB family nuclease
MTTVIWENDALTQKLEGEWKPTKAYRYHILITKDEDGTFSSIVLNLPGIGSCGASKDEALENAKEAILGAMEVYEEAGEAIPWKDTSSVYIPPDAWHQWIILDA